jgi:hypothetical protein
MDPATSDTPAPAPHVRTRFELIFASSWLAVGLFALPAAIYLTGILMLGPYKPGAGLLQFYADFFADLADPSLRAWVLALGPLILVSVVRLIFLGMPVREPKAIDSELPPPPRDIPTESPKARPRIEPRIGSE